MVPFAAGGPTDKVAREIAQLMSKQLGTTMVIDNAAGAGGTIGTKKVVQAKNDGYTVLIHHIGIATSVGLYRNLGYDPLKDLEMIGEIADVPMVLLGAKTLPPATMKELVTYVRANATKISLANAGIGSASHLCGLLLQKALQTELNTIPTRDAPALNDLMGGQVNLMCDQTTNVAGQVKAGAVKAYAAMQPQRIRRSNSTAIEEAASSEDLARVYVPKGTRRQSSTSCRALQMAVRTLASVAKWPSWDGGACRGKSDRNHCVSISAGIAKWTDHQSAGAYAD